MTSRLVIFFKLDTRTPRTSSLAAQRPHLPTLPSPATHMTSGTTAKRSEEVRLNHRANTLGHVVMSCVANARSHDQLAEIRRSTPARSDKPPPPVISLLSSLHAPLVAVLAAVRGTHSMTGEQQPAPSSRHPAAAAAASSWPTDAWSTAHAGHCAQTDRGMTVAAGHWELTETGCEVVAVAHLSSRDMGAHRAHAHSEGSGALRPEQR